MIGPMNGTKRRTIESMPQSTGLGTPISHRPMPMGMPYSDVHDQLHQQIPADPLGGVAQGLGCPVQIAGAEEPDETVAQVLPLQQHEHDEDDDDAGGRQRLDQRSDDGLQQLQRRGVGLPDLNRDRLWLDGFRLERRCVLPLPPAPRSPPRCLSGGRAAPPPHARQGRRRVRSTATNGPSRGYCTHTAAGSPQVGRLARRRRTRRRRCPGKQAITTVSTAGVRGIPRRRSAAINGASAKLRSPASASGTNTSRPK